MFEDHAAAPPRAQAHNLGAAAPRPRPHIVARRRRKTSGCGAGRDCLHRYLCCTVLRETAARESFGLARCGRQSPSQHRPFRCQARGSARAKSSELLLGGTARFSRQAGAVEHTTLEAASPTVGLLFLPGCLPCVDASPRWLARLPRPMALPHGRWYGAGGDHFYDPVCSRSVFGLGLGDSLSRKMGRA